MSTVPKRGGEHTVLGVYMGGCGIDSNYEKVKNVSYQHSLQLRNLNALIKSEANLMKSLDDTTTMKYNGKIDLKPSETSELNKEQFLKAVKRGVKYYGFEKYLFYVYQKYSGKISCSMAQQPYKKE